MLFPLPRVSNKNRCQVCVVVHACHPSPKESEAEGLMQMLRPSWDTWQFQASLGYIGSVSKSLNKSWGDSSVSEVFAMQTGELVFAC